MLLFYQVFVISISFSECVPYHKKSGKAEVCSLWLIYFFFSLEIWIVRSQWQGRPVAVLGVDLDQHLCCRRSSLFILCSEMSVCVFLSLRKVSFFQRVSVAGRLSSQCETCSWNYTLSWSNCTLLHQNRSCGTWDMKGFLTGPDVLGLTKVVYRIVRVTWLWRGLATVFMDCK